MASLVSGQTGDWLDATPLSYPLRHGLGLSIMVSVSKGNDCRTVPWRIAPRMRGGEDWLRSRVVGVSLRCVGSVGPSSPSLTRLKDALVAVSVVMVAQMQDRRLASSS